MAAAPEPHRFRRRGPLVPALLIAVLLAGCGSAVEEGSRLTVYVGGAGAAADQRQTAEGAALALEQAGGEAGGVPIELVDLAAAGAEDSPDGAGGGEGQWVQAQIAAGAREAAQDSTSVAYLGETTSAATAVSVPVTNEAGILQVATGPVGEELVREPGGNGVPDDFQTTGERTVVALAAEGAPVGLAPDGDRDPPPELDSGFEADFEDAYGQPPGLAAAYGHAAMSHVLAAIAASDDPLDRLAVISAALASGERDSALGSYSIDPAGLGSLGG